MKNPNTNIQTKAKKVATQYLIDRARQKRGFKCQH